MKQVQAKQVKLVSNVGVLLDLGVCKVPGGHNVYMSICAGKSKSHDFVGTGARDVMEANAELEDHLEALLNDGFEVLQA